MKKKVFALLLCGLPMIINAQDAFDVLQMSQTELRGTSRFQSMAGAFGALGGDLSTLTQNPAGIGVYRSSDLGITFGLDFNSTKAGVDKLNETKFNVNNVGYVGAIRLDSESVPNLNFGFTYNRLQSFNRHYMGGVGSIPTSMSNFIADEFVNVPGYKEADLYWEEDFNPYFDGYAPWAAVTTYDMETNNGGYVGIINANGVYMQVFTDKVQRVMLTMRWMSAVTPTSTISPLVATLPTRFTSVLTLVSLTWTTGVSKPMRRS